jgi:hypothetical protein
MCLAAERGIALLEKKGKKVQRRLTEMIDIHNIKKIILKTMRCSRVLAFTSTEVKSSLSSGPAALGNPHFCDASIIWNARMRAG